MEEARLTQDKFFTTIKFQINCSDLLVHNLGTEWSIWLSVGPVLHYLHTNEQTKTPEGAKQMILLIASLLAFLD